MGDHEHVPIGEGDRAARGERVNESTFALGDGRILERPKYVEGYRDQVQFVSKMALSTAQSIIAQSRERPVIIIQPTVGLAPRWTCGS